MFKQMPVLAAILGLLIILTVLLDAFETVVLPRRVQRSFRLTALFYRVTWTPWARFSRHVKSLSRRETYLSYFGPLSLIFLLVVWALSLIFGFALLQYGLGEHLQLGNEKISFGALIYHSGETFFTLGYGDIIPNSWKARALAVFEAGMGFAFLGVVIGYLPIVYDAFADRELEISLLDSRAGSPPTATEMLNRLGCCPDGRVLDEIFRDWERWSANVLASHLSYPVLSFFRSQHVNQSWLGALTVMLDVTSLVIVGVDGIHSEQARLTFAMARHAAVDLAQVIHAEYNPNAAPRLTTPELDQIRSTLAANGLRLRQDEAGDQKLAKLRSLYEPYVQANAVRLLMTLPPWIRTEKKKDNWQGGPWDKMIQKKEPAIGSLVIDDHF
jgi:Ion channel